MSAVQNIRRAPECFYYSLPPPLQASEKASTHSKFPPLSMHHTPQRDLQQTPESTQLLSIFPTRWHSHLHFFSFSPHYPASTTPDCSHSLLQAFPILPFPILSPLRQILKPDLLHHYVAGKKSPLASLPKHFALPNPPSFPFTLIDPIHHHPKPGCLCFISAPRPPASLQEPIRPPCPEPGMSWRRKRGGNGSLWLPLPGEAPEPTPRAKLPCDPPAL